MNSSSDEEFRTQSSSESEDDDEDPEGNIHNHLSTYYDKNYISYEVNARVDYLNHQVWNVYYDQKFDLTYVFIAKISIVGGQKEKASVLNADITAEARAHGRPGSQHNKAHKFQKEIDALERYEQASV